MMRIPIRKGKPITLEEMQVRQAEMEDRLNAYSAELQAGRRLSYAVDKALDVGPELVGEEYEALMNALIDYQEARGDSE